MYEADLYSWSSLRSSYLAEANADAVRTLVVAGGWYGPGWYWDPWLYGYTFHPGYYFASPFGWGFYPPIGICGGGFYGYGHIPFGAGRRWIGGGFRGGGLRAGGARMGGFRGGFHR